MENKILKPCPFCGGDAKLCKNAWRSEMPEWFIECTQCGFKTEATFKDRIIRMWNRRELSNSDKEGKDE